VHVHTHTHTHKLISSRTYYRNVTLKNIYYFWLAPTLTYQIAFPRTPRVRVRRVVGILLGLLACVALFTFLVAQIVSPVSATFVPHSCLSFCAKVIISPKFIPLLKKSILTGTQRRSIGAGKDRRSLYSVYFCRILAETGYCQHIPLAPDVLHVLSLVFELVGRITAIW